MPLFTTDRCAERKISDGSSSLFCGTIIEEHALPKAAVMQHGEEKFSQSLFFLSVLPPINRRHAERSQKKHCVTEWKYWAVNQQRVTQNPAAR